MKIKINGKDFDTGDGVSTVLELIDSFNLDYRNTAVALNMEIIPRGRYGETELSENDVVDLVGIAPGG